LSTREKAEQFVKVLVRESEITKREASELQNELFKRGEKAQFDLKKLIRRKSIKALKEIKLASPDDIEALKKKIRQIEKKILEEV